MGQKRIKWDITSRCNMRCAHCMVGTRYAAARMRELTGDEKLRVVERLAEGGVGALTILGGEPLTVSRDLLAIIRRAVSLGLEIACVTNGSLLSGDVMARLAESGIASITISIEGPSAKAHEAVRGPRTFDRLVRNVAALVEHVTTHAIRLDVGVNTVLNRANLGEIDAMVDFCAGLGVGELTILALGCVGFAEQNRDSLAITPAEELDAARRILTSAAGAPRLAVYTDFYPLVHDFVGLTCGVEGRRSAICCNASTSLGYVGPDGSMFPCDRCADGTYHGRRLDRARIRPMSLLEHSFYEIWNSDHFREMFGLIHRDSTYERYDPCRDCGYLRDGTCRPCPLYSLDGANVNVEVCKTVERELGGALPAGTISRGARLAPGPKTADLRAIEVDSSQPDQQGDRVPAKVEGVRYLGTDDVAMVLNPVDVEYTYLDPIAALIWNMIDGRTTLRTLGERVVEVVGDVKAKTRAAPMDAELRQRVRSDVVRCVEGLRERGVLEWADPPRVPESLRRAGAGKTLEVRSEEDVWPGV